MNLKKWGIMIALALQCAMANADTVETQGLPIHIGNTVEEVQKALNTTMEPDEMSNQFPGPMSVKRTQLHLKTKGIWVFFEKNKVYTIRVDAPFSGNVGGVKLGDPSSKITKTFGKPIKEARFGFQNTYTYYFDDVTTTKFMVNQNDEVETIYFIK
jgi:hypothetical protein